MPREMPTRGTQGLGVLLNIFNQSQISFGKDRPIIGRLRHLQSEGGTNGLEKFNSTEDLFHGPSFFPRTK